MRRRAAYVFLCAMVLPNLGEAHEARLLLEPVMWSVERLDEAHAASLKLPTRNAGRIGLGAALEYQRWQFGVSWGVATVAPKFGLLNSPNVRMERAAYNFELRWRVPASGYGWSSQVVGGVGRLRMKFRPDHLFVSAGNEISRVELSAVSIWTRQVAAELLHDLPGNSEIGFRLGWTFYEQDLATLAGARSRSMIDFQSGVLIRVQAF